MPVSDQGVFKDRYQIVPRAMVFATRKDLVLLLKGAPTKRLWANLYNGVGGHIEQGEDPLAAARREFLEETGLNLLNPWLCAVITIDTDQPVGIGMFVFRGEASLEELTPSQEGDLAWIEFGKIHDLDLVEDLPTLLPLILEMSPHSPILYGQYHYNEENQLLISLKNSEENVTDR